MSSNEWAALVETYLALLGLIVLVVVGGTEWWSRRRHR